MDNMEDEAVPPNQSNNHVPSGNSNDKNPGQNNAAQPSSNWREWPAIRIRVVGLPPATTTLQVYNNLVDYGTITRIFLGDGSSGSSGQRTIIAEVTFEPPPKVLFWNSRTLHFTVNDRPVYPRAHLDRYQPAVAQVESPVPKEVKYNEKLELYGSSLGFGYLASPISMKVMATRGDIRSPVRLVLNLKRKEIEVYFPVVHISTKRSIQREFRFPVALDDNLTIWHLRDESYILHLSKPPWYSKKLEQAVANTHSHGARLWTVEDMWARQTDIFTHKQTLTEINSTPVALHKVFNDINIFRWTTFQFRALGQARDNGTAKTFFEALQDWNISVRDGEKFVVENLSDSRPKLEYMTWKLINDTHDEGTSYTFEQELARNSLPFSVRYQLEVCLSHSWLSEYSITSEFLQYLSNCGETFAKQALVYVDTYQERLYDPMVIFNDIKYAKPMRAKILPDDSIEVHSATVTATGILFHTPTVEITNRIIRKHKAQAHRFLRVRFEDDEYRGQTRLYQSTNNKMTMIYERVKRALSQGIKLGNIKFDFLAWGNSQMREHSVYFFASTADLSTDQIRAEMGSFKENVVAKKSARMGQCFSSTKAIRLQLPPTTSKTVIPDITRGKYNFTDGVGKISPLAATLVSDQLGLKDIPCLFQFRLGGCKGVLAVSKDVPGIGVRIRDSQLKFDSPSSDLEIIRCAEFWQAFLNRQIILCLSNLGVSTEVFLRKQEETIAALEHALRDDTAATKALRNNIDPNRMTLSICELVEAGFRSSQEPFTHALLHLWRAYSLKYLKDKAKIPVSDGAFVLGTVDETATLRGHTSACPSGDRQEFENDSSLMQNLPEIFIQTTDAQTGQRRIIEGICILARNPSLHVGDIRVVRAVDVPALHHMCDVVVMPQTGERDLPSMCSGGDLDGDDYIVVWDKDLIPQIWNAKPFHYDPPEPRRVEGEITSSHMIDFFIDYLKNDSLGRIATAHLAAADDMPDSLRDHACLELAALHSMAVDYPKSGVPAVMERKHERYKWPHFMEKQNKREYHSHRVLGKLYDAVEKVKFVPNWDLPFDRRILTAFEPSKKLYEAIQAVKRDYDNSLRRILAQHAIETEFELWSTFVTKHSKAKSDFKFHEEVGMLSRTLKEQFYEALVDVAGGRDYDHLAPVAVVAYQFTHHQLQIARREVETGLRILEPDTMPFISFPWLLQETLIKVASRAGDMNMGTASTELPERKDLSLYHNGLSEHLPDPYQPRLPSSIDQTAVTTVEPVLAVHGGDTTGSPGQATQQTSTLTPGSLSIPALVDQPCKGQAHNTEGEQLSPKLDAILEVSDAIPHDVSPIGATDECIPRPLTQLNCTSTIRPVEQAPNLMTSTSNTQIPSGPRVPTTVHKHPTPHKWKNFLEDDLDTPRVEDKLRSKPKQVLTCWYWQNTGKCFHTEEGCPFAHWDTGVYAHRPFNPKVSSPTKTSLDRAQAFKRRIVASPRKRVVGYESDSSDDDVRNGNFRKPRPKNPETETSSVPRSQAQATKLGLTQVSSHNSDVPPKSLPQNPSYPASSTTAQPSPSKPALKFTPDAINTPLPPVRSTQFSKQPSPIPSKRSTNENDLLEDLDAQSLDISSTTTPHAPSHRSSTDSAFEPPPNTTTTHLVNRAFTKAVNVNGVTGKKMIEDDDDDDDDDLDSMGDFGGLRAQPMSDPFEERDGDGGLDDEDVVFG